MKSVRRVSRRVAVFLLLGGVAAVSYAAPDVIQSDALLQYVGAVLSGILIPLFLAFRRESRESLHQVRDQLQGVMLAVARLEERDRIAELLDKRLPRD